LKKIFIEFAEKPGAGDTVIPGSVNLNTGPGNEISFLFSGNINDLIVFLSGRKINNLVIEEPSLDEIFMHYYHI